MDMSAKSSGDIQYDFPPSKSVKALPQLGPSKVPEPCLIVTRLTCECQKCGWRYITRLSSFMRILLVSRCRPHNLNLYGEAMQIYSSRHGETSFVIFWTLWQIKNLQSTVNELSEHDERGNPLLKPSRCPHPWKPAAIFLCNAPAQKKWCLLFF